MWMREDERNKVLEFCEIGEERIRELCERVAVEREDEYEGLESVGC